MHNMLLPLDAYHYFGILLRDYSLCYMLAFIFASHTVCPCHDIKILTWWKLWTGILGVESHDCTESDRFSVIAPS